MENKQIFYFILFMTVYLFYENNNFINYNNVSLFLNDSNNQLMIVAIIIFIYCYSDKLFIYENFDNETDNISKNIYDIFTSNKWNAKQTFSNGIESNSIVKFNSDNLNFGNMTPKNDNGDCGNCIALKHIPGNKLQLNNGGNFKGGVNIDSNLEINGDLEINGGVKFKAGVFKMLPMQTGSVQFTPIPGQTALNRASNGDSSRNTQPVTFSKPFSDKPFLVWIQNKWPFTYNCYDISAIGFTVTCQNTSNDPIVAPRADYIAIGPV
jgi:hypothetical protein